MAVKVTTTPSYSFSSPTRLFQDPNLVGGPGLIRYDVSADGQRFILAEQAGEPPKTTIHIVENWFEEFKDCEQG